ncbi:hypothetical protein KIH74_20610 [Kineosporia sp. J2-2]|uniref:Uncharacterized protein n=1 Tax=Kineosporia corallincola TaxID=2835133 RepID=A0ABS5TJT2_9ACTN|nr:hypothetical protein [Kineosporia corallincola]MBT0771352.1 hypothetical protein [Kineosporia corallincola]
MAGLGAALVLAPPVAGAVLAVSVPDGSPAPAPVPVSVVHRVVTANCTNGRVQHGVDTGRADGLLLATDTGVAC